jgi:hypothetical protein
MAQETPPKNIADLIDRIELIREELLRIQRSMEKMSPREEVDGSINKTQSAHKPVSTG